MGAYITTVNSNIETFNQYIKVIVEGLKAMSEMNDNLMTNLSKY